MSFHGFAADLMQMTAREMASARQAGRRQRRVTQPLVPVMAGFGSIESGGRLMQTTSRVHRRSRLVAAVATAALIAGCGGDGGDDAKQDTAKFESGAKAATTETSDIGTDIGAAIQAAPKETDAALAATFTGLASRARAVVADLNALDPPAASREKVNALVGALGTGAQDLDAIATAARAHDASSARAATVTLGRDSPAITAAKDALDAELEQAAK